MSSKAARRKKAHDQRQLKKKELKRQKYKLQIASNIEELASAMGIRLK
jgi:hypothetical protein